MIVEQRWGDDHARSPASHEPGLRNTQKQASYGSAHHSAKLSRSPQRHADANRRHEVCAEVG